MQRSPLSVLAACGIALAAATLASCASAPTQTSQVASRPPAPAPARAVTANWSPQTVWHLRSGLNVAALSCKRGPARSVETDYRKLLTRHKALFSEAYQAEVRRKGMSAFDKDQTRVYNRFAGQSTKPDFCANAAEVARVSSAMDSSSLATSAPTLLAQLERGRK